MSHHTTIVLSFALLSGCSGFGSSDGDGYQYPDDFDLYDGPPVGKIQGVVYDELGEVLADIPVGLSSGDEALTDSDGLFRFTDLDSGSYVLDISVMEYSESFKKVTVQGWESQSVSFDLYPVGAIFELDNSLGGRVREGRLQVDVPPLAFAVEGGSAVSGDIQLAVTAPDLLSTGAAGAPGNFSVFGESEGALASFGFWDIRVYQDGEQINVADGQEVALSYELVEDESLSAQAALLEDVMDLWWFNPDEASWEHVDELPVEERDDGSLGVTANLPHFSPWNLDYLFDSTCVEVTVKDELDNPVIGVEVSLTGTDYISTITSSTDDTGTAIVMGMPNGTAYAKAELMVGDRPFREITDPIDLGGATSGGAICPIKEEIKLPICMVGGDMGVVVSNYKTQDEDGDVTDYRVPSGSAQFYEPSGEYGACADPLGDELEPGEWITLDGEEDPLDLYAEEDNENMSVGEIVRLSDDDVAIDLTIEEDADVGDMYSMEVEAEEGLEMGELLQDGSTLDVKVQGEEGSMGGFLVQDAISIGVAPVTAELEDRDDSNDAVSFERGEDVTLELGDSADDGEPLYVTVGTEEGNLYLGKFAAGDDPTLPSWLTEEMSDEAFMTIFKQKNEYLAMPNGTYSRVTTMNSTTLEVQEVSP